MNVLRGQSLILLLISLSLMACSSSPQKPPRKAPKVTVASIQTQTVTLTERYTCQVRSHHHINICAVEIGYLEAIKVKERQAVKQGDVLFQVNYKKVFENKANAQGEVSPPGTDLEKARAGAEAAAALLGVADIKAPFDGVIDLVPHQIGGVVQKGETLTTLSDNSLMWAYFNLSEARYLEFKAANLDQHQADLKIELVMANGKKFDQPGKLGAIGANFNSSTGTVSFRADFPNPDNVLRHGQTGSVLISHVQDGALVVPLRATFEVGHKRYVYVVDKDDIARQREIVVQTDLEDTFVVKAGVSVGDVIVVDGIKSIRNGDKVEYDHPPNKVAVNAK